MYQDFTSDVRTLGHNASLLERWCGENEPLLPKRDFFTLYTLLQHLVGEDDFEELMVFVCSRMQGVFEHVPIMASLPTGGAYDGWSTDRVRFFLKQLAFLLPKDHKDDQDKKAVFYNMVEWLHAFGSQVLGATTCENFIKEFNITSGLLANGVNVMDYRQVWDSLAPAFTVISPDYFLLWQATNAYFRDRPGSFIQPF